MMKKTAIIGTGIMGHGMAMNFLKAGHEVYAWNRSVGKLEELKKKGAHIVETPREAAEQADRVFEVTASDESSRAVWTGPKGILAGATPNKALITNATLSILWTDELAQLCEQQGYTFFDMPLTGSRMGAESGQLTLLVGGNKDALENIREDLDAISVQIHHFGPVGSGMRYKLILNMLQAIHVAGFGAALQMARAAGLDEKQVGDTLAEKPGGVPTQMAWRDYQNPPDPVNFALQWIIKDLEYAANMTGSNTSPLLQATLEEFNQAIEQGKGNLDWTQINK